MKNMKLLFVTAMTALTTGCVSAKYTEKKQNVEEQIVALALDTTKTGAYEFQSQRDFRGHPEKRLETLGAFYKCFEECKADLTPKKAAQNTRRVEKALSKTAALIVMGAGKNTEIEVANDSVTGKPVLKYLPN